MNGAEPESIRLAMDQAWRDHQHTRDQTWKALQIEFFLVASIVAASWQLDSPWVTAFAAAFACVVALCGVQITLRHRNSVELRKFEHIMNCEKALGLHQDCLISGVKKPAPMTLSDALNPAKANTAVFILRMHLAILVFALFVLIYTLVTWGTP